MPPRKRPKAKVPDDRLVNMATGEPEDPPAVQDLVPSHRSGKAAEKRRRDYQREHDAEFIRQQAREDVRLELASIRNSGRVPDLRAITKSAREEMDEEQPEIAYAVQGLAKIGSVVTLPSTRKTGKSTFLANLAMDGLYGMPFLDKFETSLGEWDVCVINAEMGKRDYLEMYRDLDNGPDQYGEDPYEHLHFMHCREEGIKLNLLNDAVVEEFMGWLHWNCCKWLFLDPWKNICGWAGVKMNDPDGVNALTERIQQIQSAAELDMVVVPMHTPQVQAEGSEDRGKGAGELEDGADALWRYVKRGKGQGAPRFLSVTGRGVGLDETEVRFDPIEGKLSLGDKNLEELQVEKLGRKILDNIRSSENGELPTTELYAGMNRNRGIDARLELENQGLIQVSKQVGQVKYWKESSGRNVKIS